MSGSNHVPSSYLNVDELWFQMPYELRQEIGSWIMEDSVTFNARVRRVIREGINAGELEGDEAFAVIDAVWCPQVYHGSSVSPEALEGGVLRPSQAFWGDAAGRVYNDGEPAVCFTPDRPTAVMRALLRPDPADHSGQKFAGFHRTPEGRVWRMVSAATLLAAQDKVACVYTASRLKIPQHVFPNPQRMPEHRILEPVAYDFAVRVGCAALPQDLLVVDANRDVASRIWSELLRGAHPLDLTHLADIQPLGGRWDVADHPIMRQLS